METQIRNKLRNYIVETFLFGEGGDDLSNDDSLLERGIIDSTGILEIVSFLEMDLGVKVDDRELVPENFDSIARMVAFIERKRGEA